MRNFALSGILGASLGLLQGCWAQLPQECFLHSKTHGGLKVGSYQSDLPMLESRYDPTWDFDSVKGYLSLSGALKGLRITHINERNTKVPLNVIGARGDRLNKTKFKYNEAKAVGILYTEDFVCNVEFISEDDRLQLLSESLEDSCNVEDEGVEQTVLKLDKDYPLVGFHGRERDGQVVDLGLIWLDARNEKCQKTMTMQEQNLEYGENKDLQSAKDAYKSLSDEERHRGTELEALLTFHSLIRSDVKQDELKQSIQELVLDLQFEQSKLINDLHNSDVASNAELYQQIDFMEMELDKFINSVTNDEVSEEEIQFQLKSFHEYNQVIEQMLNPNRIFEGGADPIGLNSHEMYSMQVAMSVQELERQQSKLDAQIQMYEQDQLEGEEDVDELLEEAKNHKGVIVYLLSDQKIKSQGAVLNQDIDDNIRKILETYSGVTKLMAKAKDEGLKERYQENLNRLQHEVDFLLELKQLTKSTPQAQHIVMTFTQVFDYIEYVEYEKLEISRDFENSVNDAGRGHYDQQMALKDKEIDALKEMMAIARRDDREIISREDIDQFIVMMQDMQSLLVQQLGEESDDSTKNAYLQMFRDRQHQLNFALGLEAEFANQIDWSTGDFNETPTGQKVLEIKDLVMELQEERIDEEINEEWLQYNSMDLQESLENLVTDEEYMELELQQAEELLQQTLDEQLDIMQTEQEYLNMKPKMVTGQNQGVTKEYMENLERVFGILTFFLFLSSMTCGGCIAYAVNAKCCKSGGNKSDVNMAGQRREANTLEMQVVQTESPGVSPASRGSRRPKLNQRQESAVTFNLNLKKTGSIESND